MVKLKNQQLAPFMDVQRPRGKAQGENKNKKHQNKNSVQTFTWVGLIAAALLLGLSGLSTPKAHAADSNWGNIEVAKKAIENVAPVVSKSEVDKNSASYVFASNEFIQKPLVAETQVTIETPKPKTRVLATPVYKTSVAKLAEVDTTAVDQGAHRFPYGYCTYYVSQRRFIPWSGNAISWLRGAQSFGFATGSTPQVGAIVVTSEGRYTGHVGMIDAINGNEITITEMNYKGYGVVSSRTISANYGSIMGYIY